MSTHETHETRETRGPRVLDGGLSTALEQRGHDLSSALWTARLLLEQPAEVATAHEAYYRAGADVATTASYQASVPGLVAAGVPAEQAADVVRGAVRVARETRDRLADELDRPLLVAASVGPYGAHLADGSEYRGRYGVTAGVLRDFHGPRLELLAAEQPDLLAVETIPDTEEAAVLVPLLAELGLPAWFGYAVAEDATRAGQPLEEAYAVLAGCPVLVAAGANCSAPHEVARALDVAARVTGLPGVGYPNRGQTWDAAAKHWRGDGGFDVATVAGWAAAPTGAPTGAAFVGGCCQVGPADIADLRAALTPRP